MDDANRIVSASNSEAGINPSSSTSSYEGFLRADGKDKYNKNGIWKADLIAW